MSILRFALALLATSVLAPACARSVDTGLDAGADAPPDAASTPDAPAPTTDAAPPIAPPARGPYAGAVGTTDVSVLFPLPDGDADLLAPSAVGNHGPLLARSTFETLARALDDGGAAYDALRLVSLRLQPCSGRVTSRCQAEVRLVFQGVARRDGLAVAADGALHAFYALETTTFDALVDALLTLKAANGDEATQQLGVHPILARQGLDGPFARGLRAILLYHLGDALIERVTFFDHDGTEGHQWTFGAADRVGGEWSPRAIPELGTATRQTISGSAATLDASAHFGSASSGGLSPSPMEPLLRGDSRTTPGPEVEAAFAAAVRLQSPDLHDAEHTSCASCHLAEGARRIGELRFGLSADAVADRFTHTRSLARDDARSSVTNLHMFGYLGRAVAVMQRTANESVVVADEIAERIRRR